MAVRFGGFTLDADRRQLLEGRGVVHLEPKAYELLSLLVARRPGAVSKAAIHDALWGDTYVSESSLAGLIADLRTALRDDHEQARFIRTVRGFGYAFCAASFDDASPALERPLWTALRLGREIPLREGAHLIGRGEECALRCDSVRVSRRHARLSVEGDRVSIEDLGSRNGTWLRGRKLEGPAEIMPGDVVVIGADEITFVRAGQDVTTAADVD
jgi:DNA-binding winged helix-turn-helix (wHTH) protein